MVLCMAMLFVVTVAVVVAAPLPVVDDIVDPALFREIKLRCRHAFLNTKNRTKRSNLNSKGWASTAACSPMRCSTL